MIKPLGSAPFVLAKPDTGHWMWAVALALVPASLFGILAFGPYSALMLFGCMALACSLEAAVLSLFKRGGSVRDGSAALTGLLIGLSMPPGVAWYVAATAVTFAILVVKHLGGGLGRNWLNPAMAGRTLVSFIWVKEMTIWQEPFSWLAGGGAKTDAVSAATVDAVAGATPLELVFNNVRSLRDAGIEGPFAALGYFGMDKSLWDFLWGNISGSMGEISKIALLAGAVYLFYRRILTWDVVLGFLAAIVFSAWVWGGWKMEQRFFAGDPVFYLVSGSTLFTALYIVTDPVTNPGNRAGRAIFGAGCGVLTVLIKNFTYLPEGSMIAVLAMNLARPWLDSITRPRPLGYGKPNAHSN